MPPSRRPSRSGSRGYARTDRLGELLREIVAEQLERIDDERLELVTVTGVDVDRELERARVYYTSLGADDQDADVAAALAEHRGRVRKAVGDQARVRRVPELVFIPDATMRSAERIERIIRDIRDAEPAAAEDAGPPDDNVEGADDRPR
jgi:ribosome-binding factor A